MPSRQHSGPRRKPGTRPKGARKPVTCRIPVGHAEVYQREAAKAGLALSDYFAMTMAAAHGLPRPDYMDRDRDQGELPISA